MGLTKMNSPVRVLMITSEWPTLERPLDVPFLVQQVAFLRQAGVEVEVFSFRGARNPINYLKAWWRLRKTLDPGKYDVVHAQFGQAGLLPWPKRLPLVITFHGCEVLGVKGPDGITTLPGKFMQKLSYLVARGANAVIIVSNQMRQYLPKKEMHVLPTGVDLASLPIISQADARKRMNLDLTERLVLFVGNPESQRKRYSLAREAMDILSKRLDARLILGWNMTHDEVLMMMQACDVMIVASRQEGSPTVVKEALACDLPIVSVVVGDVPERLEGIDGCEICVDDRPETIAAALERVLNRGRRINGRQVMHELDEPVLAQKLIGIYRSVIKPQFASQTEMSESKTPTMSSAVGSSQS